MSCQIGPCYNGTRLYLSSVDISVKYVHICGLLLSLIVPHLPTAMIKIAVKYLSFIGITVKNLYFYPASLLNLMVPIWWACWFPTSPQRWCQWHDDVITWKCFLHYWPFVWGIPRDQWIHWTKSQYHLWLVDSSHIQPVSSVTALSNEYLWWFCCCTLKMLKKPFSCQWCEMPWRSYDNPDNKVHRANMGPPGSCRPQMGPMLTPCTLLSGITAME